MKKLYVSLIIVICFFSLPGIAQIGGLHTYEFLNLSGSSRITALGGIHVSPQDEDLSLTTQNPALLNKSMLHQIQLSHEFYFASIQHGYVSHAFQLKEKILLSAGLQYISYGTFEAYDELGIYQRDFTGGEYNLQLSSAYQISPKWSAGLSLKTILSNFDEFNSVGLASDWGVAYNDTTRRFSAGLVVKNAGAQLSTYNGVREDLPFDIQLGITQRLKYLPFQFGVMLHHLHKWDIRYDDPALQEQSFITNPEDSVNVKEPSFFFDKAFRHVNLNGELFLGKTLRIRLGYNHFRRQELKVTSRSWLSGFSGGFGIRIKRFAFDFGKAFYVLPSSTNHISLSFRMK